MLRNLKIRHQLTLFGAFVIGLTALVTGVYLILLAQIRNQSDQAAALNSAALSANDAAIATQYMAYNLSSYSLGHLENHEDFTTHLARFDKAVAALNASVVLTSDERQKLAKVAAARTKYVQTAQTLFDATDTYFRTSSYTERAAAKARQDQTWTAQYFAGNNLDVIFSDLVLTLSDRAAEANTSLQQFIQEAKRVGLLLPLLAIILSVIVVMGIRRTIAHPLQILGQATADFAKGDYSQRAAIENQNELGELGLSFNQMADAVELRNTELSEMNRSLEQRVGERTQDYRKAHDEAVAATRLAQEHTRLKSEFLATMSHELRTPLNAIGGFAGILLNKFGGTDFNAKAENYIQRIQSNSDRLLQLINDFLDLSRIESGRLDLANQPFAPAELAKRWQSEIGVLADKKGLKFKMYLDSALPAKIYGDEEAVSKVAINLLGNAIKFTEHGQVDLFLTCDNAQWQIVVRDTGIGIPSQAREFIFEEFRQVDQSSNRKHSGTGLGLAIVQRYVRAMGGSVNLKSELGKGSTFTVTLPYKVNKSVAVEGIPQHG
jgi:signal transduction histidine kinase